MVRNCSSYCNSIQNLTRMQQRAKILMQNTFAQLEDNLLCGCVEDAYMYTWFHLFYCFSSFIVLAVFADMAIIDFTH